MQLRSEGVEGRGWLQKMRYSPHSPYGFVSSIGLNSIDFEDFHFLDTLFFSHMFSISLKVLGSRRVSAGFLYGSCNVPIVLLKTSCRVPVGFL